MTSIIDSFVEDAKAVTIAECLDLLHLPHPKGKQAEYIGPCPLSGGKDRFSYNIRKNVWNCRGCNEGGHGALGLAGHVLGLDLKKRDGFLAACSAVLGQPIPDKTLVESEEQQKAREEALRKKQALAKRDQEKKQKQAEFYRQRERNIAKSKWKDGRFLASTPYEQYIERRSGALQSVWPLRVLENEPYFHNNKKIYSGPAIVAPFVAQNGDMIGCHLTWLDLNNPPKYRPSLIDEDTGEKLATKKMRGTKKGGIIPLFGFIYRNGKFHAAPDRYRMVVGEGIETVLAMRFADGERDDTIYAAAGDLGNFTGPATPDSRFKHPELKHSGKDGKLRPIYVAGPVPLISGTADSIWIPDHVTELVLIADGDSEPIMTASAMARAKARFTRPNRKIPVLWPLRGMDIADMVIKPTPPENTDKTGGGG